MSIRSIECQIARGQISRYLAGDTFSSEALAQLEAHVSGCSDCKEHLTERKSALQTMLGKPQSPAQAEYDPAPETAPAPAPGAAKQTQAPLLARPLVATVLESLKARMTRQAPTGTSVPTAAWKPIAYSVALALVLGAMSLASRNMDRMFGPRAAESAPSAVAAVSATQEIEKQPAKVKHKPSKIRKALKKLPPIEDSVADAAKAAHAARAAAWTKRALARIQKSSHKAAQAIPIDYQSEPAPRLTVPGSPVTKKKTPKPSVLRKAPAGVARVAHLAKRGIVEPKPRQKIRSKPRSDRMLEVEARPKRRAISHPRVVLHRHAAVKKFRKPKAVAQGIRVYAPEATP